MDVGERDVVFAGEGDELVADAVDEDDLDRQATQHGDVGHDVREILVADDRAIDGDHEDVVTEHLDVSEDSP